MSDRHDVIRIKYMMMIPKTITHDDDDGVNESWAPALLNHEHNDDGRLTCCVSSLHVRSVKLGLCVNYRVLWHDAAKPGKKGYICMQIKLPYTSPISENKTTPATVIVSCLS